MDETIEVIVERPWQGTALAILQMLNILVVGGILAFMIAAGYAGFKGGEMGVIIGVGGVGGLIILLPLLVVLIIMVVALFKGRRWAVIVALILTIATFFPVLFTLEEGFTTFLFGFVFWGFTLWMEIACLKNPFYAKKYKQPDFN